MSSPSELKTKITALKNRIERAETKLDAAQHKEWFSQKYYTSQLERAKEKYDKEVAYWLKKAEESHNLYGKTKIELDVKISCAQRDIAELEELLKQKEEAKLKKKSGQ